MKQKRKVECPECEGKGRIPITMKKDIEDTLIEQVRKERII
mgnify:CR=1 FL=1